jgi:hypothetical protein
MSLTLGLNLIKNSNRAKFQAGNLTKSCSSLTMKIYAGLPYLQKESPK